MTDPNVTCVLHEAQCAFRGWLHSCAHCANPVWHACMIFDLLQRRFVVTTVLGLVQSGSGWVSKLCTIGGTSLADVYIRQDVLRPLAAFQSSSACHQQTPCFNDETSVSLYGGTDQRGQPQ